MPFKVDWFWWYPVAADSVFAVSPKGGDSHEVNHSIPHPCGSENRVSALDDRDRVAGADTHQTDTKEAGMDTNDGHCPHGIKLTRMCVTCVREAEDVAQLAADNLTFGDDDVERAPSLYEIEHKFPDYHVQITSTCVGGLTLYHASFCNRKRGRIRGELPFTSEADARTWFWNELRRLAPVAPA